MTFWTISYGKQEHMSYSGDEGMNMEYAYLRWDENVDEYEETMNSEYRLYNRQKQCGPWLNEILEHIGEDKYIYELKYKWDGEFLIFYRAKMYKHEREDRIKNATSKAYDDFEVDD